MHTVNLRKCIIFSRALLWAKPIDRFVWNQISFSFAIDDNRFQSIRSRMLFSDGFIFLLDNAIIYAVTVTVCSIAYRGVLLFNFNVDRYSCTDTVVICNKVFFFHIMDSHRNSADLCRLLFRRALPTRKPTVENSVYSIDKKKKKKPTKNRPKLYAFLW